MKKLIFTCLLFLFIANITKAQFVEIPDSNFRNVLKTIYPTCFNASNMMDTTCSAIVNEIQLYIYRKNTESIEGIQYFKNLKELFCYESNLSSLPVLPNSLFLLDCSSNQLSSLPSLPSSLTHLNCENNQLTNLPTLPSSLTFLNCCGNQLSSLPSLPGSLNDLCCGGNQLSSLPSLPGSLTGLYCGGNLLSSLPSLPSSLSQLYCNDIQLSSLPALPNSLNVLYCPNNQLSSLPALPNSLDRLECDNNQLSSLPSLPSSLGILYCSNNQLTSLPSLPSSLFYLNCYENPLNCLPPPPNNILSVQIRGTNIKCLPGSPNNFEPNFELVDTILPFCTDPSDICQVQSFAKGFVYNDANSNGIFDSLTEPVISNQIISVSPNDWKGISDINGVYLVKLDTAINNNWSCNTTNNYATIVPDSYSATPTSLDLLPNEYNFGIRFKPNIKDLEAMMAGTVARPGFTTNMGVTANNIGTVNQSNITVKLKKPSGYDTVATSTPPTSILDDTLFWENVSIDFLDKKAFYVEFQVPISAELGTEIVYEAWVNGTEGDTTPIDNYAKWTETIRGSYDPNDKLVSKTTLPPAYDVEKDRLIYTIRFQNTGTDTAFYVRVKDEIPANLNLSTLKVINASHAYQLIVREKNIVEFAFPNIILPDKTTNEPKSHGFVQFSIQPKAGLPVNTKIENNAAIYFDYNAPIITNFATTEVKLTTGLANNKNLDFKLYPNPTNGTVRIELPYSGDGNWILSDISGRQLKADNIANNEKLMELNLKDLPLGTYFITIQLGGNVSTAKIIKM